MNGSGIPLAGIMASTTLMLNKRLHNYHRSEAGRQKLAEHVFGAKRGPDAAIEEDAEERDHQQRAPQSHLFRGHGEDKVSMRLRQVEQFLLAFHQPQPRQTSCAHGDHRLNNVEAFALRIFKGIEECLHSCPSPGYADHQKIQRQQRGGECVPTDISCSSPPRTTRRQRWPGMRWRCRDRVPSQ